MNQTAKKTCNFTIGIALVFSESRVTVNEIFDRDAIDGFSGNFSAYAME